MRVAHEDEYKDYRSIERDREKIESKETRKKVRATCGVNGAALGICTRMFREKNTLYCDVIESIDSSSLVVVAKSCLICISPYSLFLIFHFRCVCYVFGVRSFY